MKTHPQDWAPPKSGVEPAKDPPGGRPPGSRGRNGLVCWLLHSALALYGAAESAELRLERVVLGAAWSPAEWRLPGAPVSANPFDPDVIRIDAEFVAPSGRVRRVPAFWHQEFRRELKYGREVLEPVGDPHWRLRFMPEEAGLHKVRVAVAPDGLSTSCEFTVDPASASASRGWITTRAGSPFLHTTTGAALPLIGANFCWSAERRTYDYDDWFAALQAAGGNFARLWLAPWSMALEQKPGTLNRYDLAEAWYLDHVFTRAAETGIHLLLALDYHGMLFTDDPSWGGSNNSWRLHSPYARERGGPCATPGDFFTDANARRIYQKRLRYLLARYGHHRHLIAWQFFNEIDNAYAPRSNVVAEDVVAWHREMARWMRAHDAYGHLISTSLTGGSDRPEYWTLPEMDFSVFHSYADADPARRVAALSLDMASRYGKPVMIGEFGTGFRGWERENDPHLRGFRQGLWGGVLGGSMGTSMSWWWEDLHREGLYPLYRIVADVMGAAGWNSGHWRPLPGDPRSTPPSDLGPARAGGSPFAVDVALNRLRLNRVPGRAAIACPLSAARAAERLPSYLHGTRRPDLPRKVSLAVRLASSARLLVHVDSVAADADLVVRVDGAEVWRETLRDRDGKAVLNREIDREFSIPVPAGLREVEVSHEGADWVALKRLRLEGVVPSEFAGGWDFQGECVGLASEGAAVVYLRSPHVAWPAGARLAEPPRVEGAAVSLADWSGSARVTWIDPRTGSRLAVESHTATDTGLRLAAPAFTEDLLVLVKRPDVVGDGRTEP